jgi:dTDP-4-dehydrorhamnose reductase
MVERAKILVIGHSGQVASELARAAWPRGVGVEFRGRDSADLASPASLETAIAASRPRVVINAGAYTAVDKAEGERVQAFIVNRDGPAALAAACTRAEAALIHISTDYVFNGAKNGAYVEDDAVGPLSVYGQSKEAGERLVRAALPQHVILRTEWVYSPFGQNFVKTMLRLGAERDELRIVADQRGCPTAARDIAATIIAMAGAIIAGKTDGFGTFHYCGADETTWCDFARAIFADAAAHGVKTPTIHAIATADYPTPATRPKNSVLDCARIGAVYGIKPTPWRAALKTCMDELLVRHSSLA